MHDVMDRHGRPSLGKLARLQYDVGLMYEATKNVDVAGTHYLVARNVSGCISSPFLHATLPALLSLRVVFICLLYLYCITCFSLSLYYFSLSSCFMPLFLT